MLHFRNILLTLITVMIPWVSSCQNDVNILKIRVQNPASEEQMMADLLSLGEYYFFIQLDSSVYYLEMAYQISSKKKPETYHYKITNALGLVYQEIDLSQAAAYFYESLEAVEQIDRNDELLPIIWMNLGTLHRQTGEHDKALEFFNMSLDKMTELRDSLGMAECYNNIGTAMMAADTVEKGMEYWEKALDLKLKLGEDLSAANTMYNMAIYYTDTNLVFEGIELAKRAIEIFEKQGRLDRLAGLNAVIGDGWSRNESWQKAIVHYDLSLNYLDSMNSNAGRLDVLKNLGIALYETNQNKRARWIFKKWENMLKIEGKDEINRHVVEISTKYESEKIQKEVDLLKKENELRELQVQQNKAEIKRKSLQTNLLILGVAFLVLLAGGLIYIIQQRKKAQDTLQIQKDLVQEKSDQLSESLKQKEALLKEIHHRVKNNLEIISSLIELQSGNVSDEETTNFMKSWQNRIDSIALIHRDLYKTDNFSSIRLNEYLDNLVHNISNVFGNGKNIKIDLEISPDIRLHIDQTIPVGLIVNELISNAYKYAFADRDQGKIEIRAEKNDQQIHLRIADDGIGIEENKQGGSSDSLGLRLVHILARQVNGNLKISNENGTKVDLKFNQKT